MKTISEYLENNSVFTTIFNETKAPIVTTIGASSLDLVLDQMVGDRLLTDKFIKDAEKVLKAFSVGYKSKLEYLEKLTLLKVEIDTGAGRRLKEVIKTSHDKKFDSDEVNKVSSFNDDTLVSDTGRNSLHNENSLGDSDRVLTDENFSLTQAFNNLQLLDKNNIINSIVKDVAQYISLSIY